MKYKGSWEDITEKMGYWVDMNSPYLTYDNKYIESVWWLLGKMHKKGFRIEKSICDQGKV